MQSSMYALGIKWIAIAVCFLVYPPE